MIKPAACGRKKEHGHAAYMSAGAKKSAAMRRSIKDEKRGERMQMRSPYHHNPLSEIKSSSILSAAAFSSARNIFLKQPVSMGFISMPRSAVRTSVLMP